MPASIAKAFASGTTDVQVVSGPGVLAGPVIITQAGVAAPLALYDGTSTAGAQLFAVTAPLGTSQWPVPNVRFGAGLFLDRDATNAQAVTLYLAQGTT